MTRPYLMIGTPAYGGMLHLNFVQSLLALLPALEREGVGCEWVTPSAESLVTRARNAIVAEFLGEPRATHLLFLDADIGFPPDLVPRMLRFDRPVVGAACPRRGIDWERLHALAPRARDGAALRALAADFVLNVGAGAAPDGVAVDDGFVQVREAGTGVLLVRRDAFDRLRARYPELRYANDAGAYRNARTEGNFWLFFDTLHDAASGRYLSEDYAFCHRWREGCGGEVWVDVRAELTHRGPYAFRGSWLDQARLVGGRE